MSSGYKLLKSKNKLPAQSDDSTPLQKLAKVSSYLLTNLSAVKPFNSTPDQNPINSLQISNTIDNIPITIEEPLQIFETVDPFQFIDDINIDDLLKNNYCPCHDSCQNAPATFDSTDKSTNNHTQIINQLLLTV